MLGSFFYSIAQNSLALIVGVLVIGIILTVVGHGDNEAFRLVAPVTSLLVLVIGALSGFFFDRTLIGYQFGYSLNILPQYNLELAFGVDGIALSFLLLTLFVFPLCFLSARGLEKRPRAFFSYLLVIELLLVLTFTTIDLFYFYVFFESLLIPMFIIIGVWGARERKIKAAYYFFLYTLFGSLFILFGILYLYFLTGTTNFNVILEAHLEPEQQQLIWLCFFIAFAVKIPLFPFHIWLPEAHVEAPTVGSILLASLLLKLGGYGFLRFSISMLVEGAVFFLPLVFTLSALGVIYGSLATIRQIDLKRIIAYSSVAHINLAMLGLFSFSQQGIEGSIYLMISHGIVSPALFFCVGILYDRYHTRLVRYYGGLVTVMPLFATALFVFSLANISFPGTPNFLGELLLFLGLFSRDTFVTVLGASGIVFSAVYSVWLFNRVAFGTLKTAFIRRFTDSTSEENFILAVLLIASVFFGLNGNIILDLIHTPVQYLLQAYLTDAPTAISFFMFGTSLRSSAINLTKNEKTVRIVKLVLCTAMFLAILLIFFLFQDTFFLEAAAKTTEAAVESQTVEAVNKEIAPQPEQTGNKAKIDKPQTYWESARAYGWKKPVYYAAVAKLTAIGFLNPVAAVVIVIVIHVSDV